MGSEIRKRDLNSDGDLNRGKIKIRGDGGGTDVPQKSSRGETSLTLLININDRGYYTHDAYCLHRI